MLSVFSSRYVVVTLLLLHLSDICFFINLMLILSLLWLCCRHGFCYLLTVCCTHQHCQ